MRLFFAPAGGPALHVAVFRAGWRAGATCGCFSRRLESRRHMWLFFAPAGEPAPHAVVSRAGWRAGATCGC